MTEGVFEETLTKNLLVRCELTASVDSDAQQSAQHLAVDTCSDIEAMTQLSKPEHTLRLRQRAHTPSWPEDNNIKTTAVSKSCSHFLSKA